MIKTIPYPENYPTADLCADVIAYQREQIDELTSALKQIEQLRPEDNTASFIARAVLEKLGIVL